MENLVQKAFNVDRSGLVVLERLMCLPMTRWSPVLDQLGLQENVTVACWYIWWERRQMAHGEQIQTAKGMTMSINPVVLNLAKAHAKGGKDIFHRWRNSCGKRSFKGGSSSNTPWSFNHPIFVGCNSLFRRLRLLRSDPNDDTKMAFNWPRSMSMATLKTIQEKLVPGITFLASVMRHRSLCQFDDPLDFLVKNWVNDAPSITSTVARKADVQSVKTM